MNKILLCFILVISHTIYAQSPTYEETVSYIIQNTKGRMMYPGALDAYSRSKGYYLKDIKIEQNGKIELITDQKVFDGGFNIIFNIFDLVEKVDYPDGIRAYKFLVHFSGLNVSEGYGITFATDADAQKVARAFRHLKTMCKQDDDLFAKPSGEDKKSQLSKEETEVYIRKKLNECVNATYYKGYITIKKNEITIDENNKVTYTLRRDYFRNDEQYTSEFNLNQISSIVPLNNDSLIVGGLRIIFNSNVCKTSEFIQGEYSVKEWGHGYYNVFGTYVDQYIDVQKYGTLKNETSYSNEITIYFSNTDSANFNRIKKAFERLKSLSADEKDPFDD
ncbi:MAG: hypothetical protein K0S23_3697 [Fluviicola sp.]|jgi:hypothetical protein|uniref:hypothetical protein n=1 Tax=Fluviicola sp. TaxID=1917219 RepID=UPI0026180CE7|nr:hypothetical protein [Fluviicola sp.]MDF3029390.1 hypothetical protein [Fluviicola sp.]